MTSLVGPLWKSIAFVVTTTLATLLLAFTIQNGSSAPGTTYHSVFADAPSLNPGDDVRMAGVRVGQVTDVRVENRRKALVTFTVDAGVALTADVEVAIRFRNLIGQRYLALQQGQDAESTLEPGDTVPESRTVPALDLTMLFNGFQPLFRMLLPEDVNELSFQIIKVFQGEGSTVEGLIRHTAGLTTTLAGKDQVIGEVIENLNAVLETMNVRSDELTDTVGTLQRLVSGLAEDRKTIGRAITGMGDLAISVGALLERGRDPLRGSVRHLDTLAGNLVDAEKTLDKTLANLPRKLEAVGRTASYGSWVNFYLCSVDGRLPTGVEGYQGGVGVEPTAGRCRG